MRQNRKDKKKKRNFNVIHRVKKEEKKKNRIE